MRIKIQYTAKGALYSIGPRYKFFEVLLLSLQQGYISGPTFTHLSIPSRRIRLCISVTPSSRLRSSNQPAAFVARPREDFINASHIANQTYQISLAWCSLPRCSKIDLKVSPAHLDELEVRTKFISTTKLFSRI